jgi:hypothetical protein
MVENTIYVMKAKTSGSLVVCARSILLENFKNSQIKKLKEIR